MKGTPSAEELIAPRFIFASYPHLALADRVRAYGMWAGLPGYLRELDPTRDLWEMVAHAVLRPEARLAVEPDWLRFTDLRADRLYLRADRLYTSIVRAVAMGSQRPSEVAQAVGRQSAAEVMPPLTRLLDVGIVERRVPLSVRAEGRPAPRYRLADPFLAFWYRFVDPRRGAIRRVLTAGASVTIAAEIAAELDSYIARYVFGGICQEWVWIAAQRGLLPDALRIGDVGMWWGGRDGAQDEIDVVALSPQQEGILYGECKWSAAPMDMRDLGGLRAAIVAARRDIPPVDRLWRVLFSRSGFHPDLQAEAAVQENRIILVDLERLYAP